METLENFLWSYFSKVGWRESHQFANLCYESKDLLDFQLPRGLRIGITGLSTNQFQNGFSFNLNGQRSAGFLFSSLPLEPKLLRFPYSPYFPSDEDDDQVVEETDVPPQPFQRSYLLSGKFCEGGRLESLYVHHWTKRIMTIFSSGTYLRKEAAQGNAQLLYEGKHSAAEFILSSQDQLVGTRGIWHITPGNKRFSFGGEIYYAFKEGNPGVSLGFRYQNFRSGHQSKVYRSGYINEMVPQSAATFTLNPIFGHTSVAYTTAVWKNLNVSTRYDYNVHSFDSNFAVGMEMRKDRAIIKTKFDTAKGFSLLYQGGVASAVVSLGVQLAVWPVVSPSFGIHVEFLGKQV